MQQASCSQQNAFPFNDELVQQYASFQDSLTTMDPVEWSFSDHEWASLMNICDKSQSDGHLSSPFDGSLFAEDSANFTSSLGEQDFSISLEQLCEWDHIPLLAHGGNVYLGALVGGTLPTPHSTGFPLSSYSPESIYSTDSQVSYCPCYTTTLTTASHSNEYASWVSGIPTWSGQSIDQFVQTPHVMTESCEPINAMPPFIINEGSNPSSTQNQVEARAELGAQNQSPMTPSLPSSGDLPSSLPLSTAIPPRTRTSTRRKKGSVAKNQVVQHALCLWDNCNQLITTDRRSVGKHIRGHLRALGLSLTTSDFATTEADRVHCLWRDDVHCPYSDQYQSEALACFNARKTWQSDRSATGDSTNFYQKLHSNRGHDVDVEFSSDGDGALLSVHSLINHICTKHLLSLAMTCSDCGEQFTRTDAHLRHQREVHKGRHRRR